MSIEDYPKHLVDAGLKVPVSDNVLHYVRQINLDDMKAVELKFPDTIITRKTGQVDTSQHDIKTKSLIWDRCIIKVEGYPDPGKNYEKVPFPHKMAAVKEIYSFRVIEAEDIKERWPDMIIEVERDQIVIYSMSRQLLNICPQRHIFKIPAENHVDTFQTVSSYTQKIKKSKVIWKSKATAETLVSMYDELILFVEGYAVRKSETEFKHDMVPPQHKIKVINALFNEILGDQDDFEQD